MLVVLGALTNMDGTRGTHEYGWYYGHSKIFVVQAVLTDIGYTRVTHKYVWY